MGLQKDIEKNNQNFVIGLHFLLTELNNQYLKITAKMSEFHEKRSGNQHGGMVAIDFFLPRTNFTDNLPPSLKDPCITHLSPMYHPPYSDLSDVLPCDQLQQILQRVLLLTHPRYHLCIKLQLCHPSHQRRVLIGLTGHTRFTFLTRNTV